MTVSSTLNRVTYTGNGATVDFAVSFPFQVKADLVVVETIIATGVQTTKTLTTHYTISGTTDTLGYYSNGGTVTAVTAPASTVTWTIYRDPSATQTLNLSENNALPAESLEAQLDYLTMLVQRLQDRVNRSLRQPEGDSASIGTLPSKVDRASLFHAYDANGDPIAAAGTSADLGPVTAFIDTLLDDADAATARTTLGAAASGAVTGSDLTMATARVLGRTTASTGAIEEISVGASLTLSGGSLSGTAASTTQAGVVELATQAEVETMTDTARAITPNHNLTVLGTAVASTSGTAIDFTGIPDGVRHIAILFSGVSLNASASLRIQLGDSGGVETSGYVGGGSSVVVTEVGANGTSGADLGSATSAATYYGAIQCTLLNASANTWIIHGVLGLGNAADAMLLGYAKSLTATLDRVRITTAAGTAAFDAGTINISYRR